MHDKHELELLLDSQIPLICIESDDESAILSQLTQFALSANINDHRPLFRWSVTDGLQRMDIALEPQPFNAEPQDVLGHIRSVSKPAIYALLDFHHYLNDPTLVRQLKDICLKFRETNGKIVLISHAIEIVPELKTFSASFSMPVPDNGARLKIVQDTARAWMQANPGKKLVTDSQAVEMLVRNLSGLSDSDTRRLARNAIFDDGAVNSADATSVMEAKYRLLNRDGLLQFEYDTQKFSRVAGMNALKTWLGQRRSVFLNKSRNKALDPPRGALLIGVQGCGKSLAAKATAGSFGVPLLRLDFGTLFSKYHGESEGNLREALRLADMMEPCVLWIDELEKGVGHSGDNTGTSQRVLGSFLTWLAERKSRVFIVATANDVSQLPPELIRKGRFDEIFFVDLPDANVRREILEIHLQKRNLKPAQVNLTQIAELTEGFSGAELEQVVIGAFYAANALRQTPSTAHLAAEAQRTRPLSVIMRERIEALRLWADGRTVSAH